MADLTPVDYDPKGCDPPAVFNVHKVALQEINRVVGNEDTLGDDDTTRIRGILSAALIEMRSTTVAEIPKYGTPEYQWWLAGATAEAAAFTEGRSEAGLRVRDFVDTLAEHRQELDEVQVAALTFEICIAGLPLRRRIRLAWKAIRR